MQNNLSGSYYLANDIDCSATSSWNGGAGFVPINSFKGLLDGRNHKITGLYINRPSDSYTGLFAQISNAVIKDIGIEGANIVGQAYIGGLAAQVSASQIYNSYFKGFIDSNAQGQFLSIGGLIGELVNSSSVEKCYTDGSVSSNVGGSFLNIGGLVGKISSSTLTNSYTQSLVNGIGRGSFLYIGGLVGSVSTTTITNTYAIGTITVNSTGSGVYVGGLVGLNNGSGVANNSYWDTEKTGVASSVLGTPRNSIQMKTKTTFPWDFDNIWCINEGVSYPKFKGDPACITCTGCAVLSGGVCVAGSSCSGEHPNCVVTDNNGICECSISSCNAGRSCSASGTCTDCDASSTCGSCSCGSSQKPTGTGACINDSTCCPGECNMATGANTCSYSDSLCPSGIACNRSTLACCTVELPYWRSSNCKACNATSGLSGNCTTKGMMCNSNYDCVTCMANMQCTCDDGYISDGAGNCVEPFCYADSECGADKCINVGDYNAFCSDCSSTNKVWVSSACESCPSGSSYHNGVCLCTDGKMWNSASNTCAKKSLVSSHGVIETRSKATQETPESRYNRIKRKMNRIKNSAYSGFADKIEEEEAGE